MAKGWISNTSGALAKEFHPVPKPMKKSQKAAKIKQFSGFQKQKPLKKSQIKRKNKQLSAEEKRIRAAVIKRDGEYCFICNREGKKEIGEHFHHIIPKKRGGRGKLSRIIDSAPLRTLISNEKHERAHSYEITPYDFYKWAVEVGYQERVILMELLINEWAKWICIDTDLASQIRKRNQERWNKFFKHDIPITPDIIGAHWEEILIQEVE